MDIENTNFHTARDKTWKKEKTENFGDSYLACFVAIFALVFRVSPSNRPQWMSPSIFWPLFLSQMGDFRVNPEHPPLAKIWAAFPPILRLKIIDHNGSSSPYWSEIGDRVSRWPRLFLFAREMFCA